MGCSYKAAPHKAGPARMQKPGGGAGGGDKKEKKEKKGTGLPFKRGASRSSPMLSAQTTPATTSTTTRRSSRARKVWISPRLTYAAVPAPRLSLQSDDVIRRCKEAIIQIHEIFNLNSEENNEEFVDTTRAVEVRTPRRATQSVAAVLTQRSRRTSSIRSSRTRVSRWVRPTCSASSATSRRSSSTCRKWYVDHAHLTTRAPLPIHLASVVAI